MNISIPEQILSKTFDDYNVEHNLRCFLHKLNYYCIVTAELCSEAFSISNLNFDGKNFKYIIQESLLINNIYDKNLFEKINNIITINENNIVHINNKYSKNIGMPLNQLSGLSHTAIRDYMTNSLWQNLRHIKLTKIIEDDKINVKFFIDNIANQYDLSQPINRQKVITFLENIAKKIIERLMTQFFMIDMEIEQILTMPPAPAPAPAIVIPPLPPVISGPPPTLLTPLEQQKIKDILTTIIDGLISKKNVDEFNANPSEQLKFISTLKTDILHTIKQKIDNNDKDFTHLHTKSDSAMIEFLNTYILKIISDKPYPDILLNLLQPEQKEKLQNKLLINADGIISPKLIMIFEHINDTFYILDKEHNDKNPGYNLSVLQNNDKKKIQKKYKKDRLIKEIIYKKYTFYLIYQKNNKEIKEAINDELKNLIQYYDNKNYYEWSNIDLFNNIRDKVIKNKYPDYFITKFGQSQQTLINKHLTYMQNTKNQYGGYNSINNSLDKINYELIRDVGTGKILHYQILDNIEGTYINTSNIEINYKLPLHIQIFYKIREKTTKDEKKIVLFNLYYERRDDLKRTEIYRDYFFNVTQKQIDDTNLNKITSLDTFDNMFKYNFNNIISFYDMFNNLNMYINQKYNVNQRKKILQLMFLLNIFRKNNIGMFDRNIITNLSSKLNPELDNKLRNIITLLTTICQTENNSNERYRYLNGLHIFIELMSTLTNINVTNIYIGNIHDVNKFLDMYEPINTIEVTQYLTNFTDNRYLKNNYINMNQMLKLKPTVPFDMSTTIDNIKSQFQNYNYNILNISSALPIHSQYTSFPKNSIIYNHTHYLYTNPSLLESMHEYTTTDGSRNINNILYRTHITSDDIATNIFNETIEFTDTYKNYLYHTLNVYQALMNCDNSTYNHDYLILTSYQDVIMGNNQKSNITDYNIGDEFFVPHMLSTSTKLESTFPQKVYGYKFKIILPTTEKYLVVFGRIPPYMYKHSPLSSISAFPNEEEIVLPPGYYKIISVTNINTEQYEIVVLYESLKLDSSILTGDLKTRTHTPKPTYSQDLVYLKEIRNQMKKHDTILDVKKIPDPVTLKELDFTEETTPYITQTRQFQGLSALYRRPQIHRLKLDKYKLSNISPLYNIFNIASDDVHDKIQNPGKETGVFYRINFKTLLYSGQDTPQSYFEEANTKKIYMSNFMVASAYGIAYEWNVRNNYTMLLDGTNSKDMIFLDNFHPYNIAILKTYYDSLPSGNPDKIALGYYYKFRDDLPIYRDCQLDKSNKFVWNNDPIRIEYFGSYYSNMKGDYIKTSISTENDEVVASIYRKIFGDHDGYITRSQFALCHFQGVFDDELCVYDFQSLKAQNKIKVLVDFPTTIFTKLDIPNNINTYIDNPITIEQKIKAFIVENIYGLRKITRKTKLNRLWESFKYSFMFDKYVECSYHPYEKYFKNIFNVLEHYNSINILNDSAPMISPALLNTNPKIIQLYGGNKIDNDENVDEQYKKKYLKYKQKYIELKNKF